MCSYVPSANTQDHTEHKDISSTTITLPTGETSYDGLISAERLQILAGNSEITTTPPDSHFSKPIIKLHIGVVKSWARLMATYGFDYLPPIVHPVQSVPEALANCYTLVKMWAIHAEGSTHLVQRTFLSEVRSILRDHASLNESELLASSQSLLLLLTILFFDFGEMSILTKSASAQLLIEVWEAKRHLAATGLFLDEETQHRMPGWESWATVSAKRRTIMALHRLEYSWSLLNGYPIVMCWELNPLPAPAARYLWQARDEEAWVRLYSQWLQLWKDGTYKMHELLQFHAGGEMDDRSELWYAEADEFGLMLVAEGSVKTGDLNIISANYRSSARSIAPQIQHDKHRL
ncbi:hypothetical protein M409DRAFT_29965 [Zasmidium cellare ATCC 36951]|uniref:Transcription factor domain-containing protein n=1 Tax=Zasmidium cellare ATCC 36951 TaxID=1080233 RepID=A0A6A6C0Z6_ZASCE|nr:uncharacterized protein M409DRAFT_29965 [Zasmidium cellare ATCC 36951]KAF2159492.1 hypothetical protein M409DRAFT_29965 [Zasmidium cellare ATCC 36951]